MIRYFCTNDACPVDEFPDAEFDATVDPRNPEVLLCRSCYQPLQTKERDHDQPNGG